VSPYSISVEWLFAVLVAAAAVLYLREGRRSGQLQARLVTSPGDLRAEALALFDFYDALAEDKAVLLETRGDGHVTGDRLMLRRALSNLLSNAIRHTPRHGRVVVSVSDDRDGMTVSVDNDGSEIAPQLLPFIFERFFRADKSRARPESESAGLGLAITKAIVAAHGGTITVARIDGRTRFSIRLPRCIDAAILSV